jgi:tRNA pseudouridine55 synthase
MGRIPGAANPDGGLVRAMAGERFVGLCRLDSGLMKAERLVSQEGLQPVA